MNPVAENPQRDIEAAVAAVRRGELIVMPTDTVYGIAADPFSPHAVDRLLTAKGRGREKPSGVLFGSWADLSHLTRPLSPAARALAETFWPGALSLILPQAPELGWDLGETGGTVALRMPLHPVALELLERTGPLAVSSANTTGDPAALSATCADADLAAAAVGALSRAGVRVADFSFDQPSLDEVFLALTGRPADGAVPQQPEREEQQA